jgi:hypothetical protein
MTQLKMLTPDDKIAEIRRLYFSATKQTIQQDLTRALDLLKTMDTEDERERATVYMQGLVEMRNDWTRDTKPKGGGPTRRAGKPGGKAIPGPKRTKPR